MQPQVNGIVCFYHLCAFIHLFGLILVPPSAAATLCMNICRHFRIPLQTYMRDFLYARQTIFMLPIDMSNMERKGRKAFSIYNETFGPFSSPFSLQLRRKCISQLRRMHSSIRIRLASYSGFILDTKVCNCKSFKKNITINNNYFIVIFFFGFCELIIELWGIIH